MQTVTFKMRDLMCLQVFIFWLMTSDLYGL